MNLDKINELITQREFETAKEALKGLLQNDENNIEALKLLGLCNVSLQSFDEARSNFETVVKFENQDAASWFYLANCYDNLEDYRHAKTAYLEVIKLRENYIDAYKNLCVVYMKSKEEDKAVEVGKKALELVQDDFRIYYMIGLAYLAQKKFKESMPYFEQALSLNPQHSQLHNNMGTGYLTLGDYDRAIHHYVIASKLEPGNSITYYNIASILQIQNKHTQACEYFEKAYNLEKLEHYLVSLALSEFKSEQYDKAIKHYKVLVSAHPEKHNFQYNLACCYEMIGEYSFAIGILDQLVLLNPKSVTMSQKLANLYSKTKQPLKAKEIYERIIGVGMVSAQIYYEYAMICAQTNNLDTAESILKKVLELDDNYAQAHKDLGVIYLDKRLFDYAKDEFEKAYKLAPEDSSIIFEYANFLYATSDYEAAKELYKIALDKEPQNPNFALFAALNFVKLNMLDEALVNVNIALKHAAENDYVLFHAGKINFLKKNYEQAQFLLIEALEINPNIETQNMLALTYFELGNYEQANIGFLSMLEENPTNISLLLSSAKCYEKLSDFDSVKSQLEKALEILPELEEAEEMLSRLSLK